MVCCIQLMFNEKTGFMVIIGSLAATGVESCPCVLHMLLGCKCRYDMAANSTGQLGTHCALHSHICMHVRLMPGLSIKQGCARYIWALWGVHMHMLRCRVVIQLGA